MTFVCEVITHVQQCCDHIGGHRTCTVPPSAARFPPPLPEDPEPEEEEVSFSSAALHKDHKTHTHACFPAGVGGACGLLLPFTHLCLPEHGGFLFKAKLKPPKLPFCRQIITASPTISGSETIKGTIQPPEFSSFLVYSCFMESLQKKSSIVYENCLWRPRWGMCWLQPAE